MYKDQWLKDFEYERRFFCYEFPSKFQDNVEPVFHVQSYYLANEGFNIRVRATSTQFKEVMTADISIEKILEANSYRFDNAFLTVKSPALGGSRYEAEREIEPSVAVELILRGGTRIIKNRYSVWIKSDGWVVDVFGGQNHGLIIAECEREKPVVDLEIPEFCFSEVTDDFRFANDNLSIKPFAEFQAQYFQDLKDSGTKFSDQFGKNRYLTDL
jgi:CYTH domain-containing protein